MTPKRYQKLANRTANGSLPYDTALAVSALGLVCEAAEAGDKIKKHCEQGHPLDSAAIDYIEKELGDTCWYIARLCKLLGLDLDIVLQKNIDKLECRYAGATFSAEASINREEYK